MDLHLQIWDGCVWIVSQIISHNIPIYSHYLFDVYWISRGLGVLGFLGYIGFQSQNASFRATCAQKGREEKRWMLWFLLNQWSTGPTGVPEKLKQSETVGNSRKQSGAARRDHAKIVNPPFLCKKNFPRNPIFFGKVQRETVGNSWGSYCFRLFPTVSVSLERQLDLWTTDSTKITTFNTFPHDPSARWLLEMMHFDFETQYTLKIPKPQDLVKFNIDVV